MVCGLLFQPWDRLLMASFVGIHLAHWAVDIVTLMDSVGSKESYPYEMVEQVSMLMWMQMICLITCWVKQENEVI